MSEVSIGQEPVSKDLAEWRDIPEEPDRMTFRGRYDHVDRAALDLIHASELNPGSKLRALDFAGGIMPFGSPTAHDLEDRIREKGLEAEIDVVDKYIPPDLNPHRPEIKYYRDLSDVNGTYDIVRALRITQFMSTEEYEKIREGLVAHLKEGGILITNQGIEFRKYHMDGSYHEPMFAGYNRPIKIMQKRDGILVPVALMPDVSAPHPPATKEGMKPDRPYRELFDEWRRDIQSGKIKIEPELNTVGFDSLMGWLREMDVSILDKDVRVVSKGNGPWNYPPAAEGADLDQILKENSLGSAEWFKAAESSPNAVVRLSQAAAPQIVGNRSLFSRFFKR